jgi:hypothetical protein
LLGSASSLKIAIFLGSNQKRFIGVFIGINRLQRRPQLDEHRLKIKVDATPHTRIKRAKEALY